MSAITIVSNGTSEFVTLADGRRMSCASASSGCSRPLAIHECDGSGGSIDNEFDERAVFNTIRIHERTIERLVAAGLVPQEKIDEARVLARGMQ